MFFSHLGPDSEPELTVEEEDEGVYSVSYLPLEIGVFDIHIRWNGKDVPGVYQVSYICSLTSRMDWKSFVTSSLTALLYQQDRYLYYIYR